MFAHDTDIAAAERFAADPSLIASMPIQVVRDGAARRRALAASDVIITCTPSQRPVLLEREIRPGAFVAPVGADNPEKQEIDPDLLASSIVIADVRDQAISIGDTRHAVAAGLMRREDVWAELGDVVVGAKRLDVAGDRTVIFDSTGMALQDVTVAALVYERAIKMGAGLRLDVTGVQAERHAERSVIS